MTFEIIYYTFSVATFLIFVFHICNLTYYKRSGRTLLGMTFKANTPENRSLLKAATQPYIWIYVAGLLLSFLNLPFSIQEVAHRYDGRSAYIVLIVYGLMIVVGFIILIAVLREMLGDGSGKPAPKDNDEDDW